LSLKSPPNIIMPRLSSRISLLILLLILKADF